jgi:hypothetical protein
VFRTELLTINGWGKIYMPFRVLRRSYRTATWTCKLLYKYSMRAYRDAKRQKYCLQFCKALGALCCGGNKHKDLDDEFEEEELIEYEEESSDEEDDGPARVVKLSNRMKKLVTPSAVQGSSYLFGYNPRPVQATGKKKKKKGKGESLDAIEEEGDDGEEEDDGEEKED